MKVTLDLPDEFMPWFESFARAYDLPLEHALTSLLVFTGASHGVVMQPDKWKFPEAFETFILPWGVRIVMNRERVPAKAIADRDKGGA